MMKKSFYFLTLILALFSLEGYAHDQMEALYEYVITNTYNDAVENGYIHKDSVLYVFWEFPPLKGKTDMLFDNYKMNISNNKICFEAPDFFKTGEVTAFRIFPPGVSREYVTISLVSFNVRLEFIDNIQQVVYENSGVDIYYFKYDKVKQKWLFHEKKSYGI